MNFELVVSESSDNNVLNFWKAIEILINNPHTINRRILICQKILTAQFKSNHNLYSYIKVIQSLSIENNVCEDNNNWIETLKINEYCNVVNSINFLKNNGENIFLNVNKLLSRSSQFGTTLEFIFINKAENYVLFLQKCISEDKLSLGTNVIYKIVYEKEGIISMYVQKIDDINSHKSINWLKNTLFIRLLKWIKQDTSVKNRLIINSLSLVHSEKYAKLYTELKLKYGTSMVKVWPENTDPSKFVYEDIAIATYLILLWENERNENGSKKLQSFVDLGCGNGLLVYILSSEGYPGLGIDLRARKLWDHFPKSTRLEVRTIIPSTSLFPDVDWLIGNHSDELTPWIPVIAARSSYNCRFFLLPCCAYEFDGSKFQRQNTLISKYSEYISCISNMSKICGFDTQLDKLRIPSTKRISLIGLKRNYSKEDFLLQEKRIQELINITSLAKNNVIKNDNNEMSFNSWSDNFKPRNPIEKVRNCTQLNQTLISDIVKLVTSKLLSTYRPINLAEKNNKVWNAGGQIDLKDIIKCIPLEMLKQLKNECGGIQTLLKNNGHIFSVIQGKVQLKIPGISSINVKKKRRTNAINSIKTKSCWFHENHPDGCPNIEMNCNFKH
ncbi:probable tRNA (uracil-O(2)-)-methyltransferase [Polistes fuscatus]|uniref:probable tRNA (uracil-O(2)-)-methyltransferase n=1 Tax=Polistes fuscatus TaxID=30207 RepID=UPI001CA96484|nr:probable tRNA (uracil-O(2)-)-methyltransferase [Polistes fuscatus]